MSDRTPEPIPDLSGAPDAEDRLVAAAREGDVAALGALFTAHAAKVRRLLRSVLGPDEELDDVAQEVFVQVHRSIRRFRGDSAFPTWLHRLAVNTAVSHLRSRARHRARFAVLPEAPAAAGPSPAARAEARELVRRLFAILDAMPVKRRVAFSLFEFEGLSLERIAEVLEITPEAAKSRVFFARREVLARAAAEPGLAAWIEEVST
jgi:RNA polymerase sigma-70 factor, ECF subfamily